MLDRSSRLASASFFIFAFLSAIIAPFEQATVTHNYALFVVLISFVAGLLTYFSSLVCANFIYSVKMIDCIKVFHY